MGNAVAIGITLDYEEAESPGNGQIWAAKAGQPLSGKVTVQVSKRVDGAELHLLAAGKERVEKKGSHQHSIDKHFLQMTAVLQDLRGQAVHRGNYVYPFVINLPDSLPSSMTYRKGSMQAHVQYKLAATFGTTTCERHFRVASRSLPAEGVVPCIVEPKTQPIQSMGIRTVGSVSFGAMIPNTHVGREQELLLAVACKNDSTVDIRRVEIKLIELLTLSTANSAVQEKIVLRESKDLELPGLAKEKTSWQTMQQRRKSGNLHETNYYELYQSMLDDSNTIRIAIPPRARDTHDGSIIKVQHYLKVKLQTQAFVDNFSAKIPVRVGYAPEQPNDDAPSVPVAPASDEIPMVAAIPLDILPDEDIVVAPTMEATAVIYSATAPVEDGPDSAVDDIVPIPPPCTDPPSLSNLLGEMLSSINDYDLIEAKIRVPEWRQVLAHLHPDGFGSMVAHVNSDFDQPRVALLVAPQVLRFRCEHCVQALRNAASWNRPTMVHNLLPFCSDFWLQRETIRSELNEWERTVTANDFEQASR